MARTIGKIRIRKLKALVQLKLEESGFYEGQDWAGSTVTKAVENEVPEEWYDTWESAWEEINRIVDDELTKLVYRGRKNG